MTVRCEDCHGDHRTRAMVEGSAHAIREMGDAIVLDTKVTGLTLEIPQVLDSITMGTRATRTLPRNRWVFQRTGKVT